MNSIAQNLKSVLRETGDGVTLVAVSKTHPVQSIQEAYQAGQRVFGENRVQELLAKQPLLPSDVQWHLIGHLQTNKVRYIAPFISMIQSVDSMKLLQEISGQAVRFNRVIDILLEVFIASEETKFGLDADEVVEMLTVLKDNPLPGIRIRGLMGMATFTADEAQVRSEFRSLRILFETLQQQFFANDPSFSELSMGMSGDYALAIAEGSTMVRIGTLIFGTR